MKKVAIAIIAVLGLYSCTEDFITKDPLGVSSTASYYNNPDQCQLAVNAVYDPLGWFEMHDEFLWKIGDICSDDCEKGGGNSFDQYEIDDWDKSGQLALFQATDRSTIMSGIWETAYIAIARANAMLDATTDQNSKQYKTMRAEVRFLRAWYVFQLTRVFGPVILPSSSVSVADAENLGNRADGDDGEGTKQVRAQYDFIISELEAVKNDLPTNASEFGKVTAGAAKAFLAKAYLYRANICGTGSSDFQKAFDVAYGLYNDANGSTYALEKHYQDVFDIYGDSHEQSKEVLFSVQYIAGSKYGRQGDGSITPIYVAPRYYWDAANGKSQQEDGIGYGFAIPTQNLLDEFGDTYDARASLILASPYKDATVNSTIVKQKLDTAAWIIPGNITPKNEGWYAIGATDWSTGYYCTKKTQLSTLLCNSGNNTQVAGKDYVLIRWAEVMLIAAEAGVQCGHEAEALTMVNALRERARNSARTIDYKKSGLTAACYSYSPATTPADLSSVDLDAVKKERRLEMYCEGERYWDLIRWNDVKKFRTEDIKGEKVSYNEATLGRWPIPQAEIILHTGGNLKQNPGY